MDVVSLLICILLGILTLYCEYAALFPADGSVISFGLNSQESVMTDYYFFKCLTCNVWSVTLKERKNKKGKLPEHDESELVFFFYKYSL